MASIMMKDEFNLLVLDKLPEAERIVRKQAASGSLTEKILKDWFGEKSKQYLFFKKARELARNSIGY